MSDIVIHSISPEEVIVSGDRHRKHFDRKASVDMGCSIREFGQLQPGLCHKVGDEVHLIMGERRLRGCADAKVDFQYMLKEEIKDKTLLEELELEENVQRENLTWQETDLAIERLHELKQKRHGVPVAGTRGGHTMQDTADQLGISKGLVSQDIELAYFIKCSPEVAAAKTKTEAKKIVKRIKETAVRANLLKESLAQQEEQESFVDQAKSQLAIRLQGLTQRSLRGKMEERLKEFASQSFDVIMFDPPWGVNYDKVMKQDGSKQLYEDSQDVVFAKLHNWLEMLYEKLKEDSHLYLFFGIVHHEFVYKTLEDVGFITNKMPLFWYKVGAHRTRTPDTWPGRCYEAIAYARKGSKPLAKKGQPDIIPTPVPTAKIKKICPSAKHPAIYLDLLQRSCAPGDRVLDPMSGSNMFGVACEELVLTHNLDWFSIEKEKNFVDVGLFNLVEGYASIVNKPVPSSPAPAEEYEEWADNLEAKAEEKMENGYEGLLPGTAEWKLWWKNNPEDQDAMLDWAKQLKGDE